MFSENGNIIFIVSPIIKRTAEKFGNFNKIVTHGLLRYIFSTAVPFMHRPMQGKYAAKAAHGPRASRRMDMWLLFAILSAVFAALTSILAKIGIEGVNSNLATAVRTVVVVIMAWGMVFLTHSQSGIAQINKKSWIFLILSGLATGASWLCYYRALQMGEVSKVVPIDKLSVVITLVLAFVFLHEEFTVKAFIGCILIGAGTLVMVV